MCNGAPGTINSAISSCVNDLWIKLKVHFIVIVYQHASLNRMCARGIDCPWINGEIKKAMHDRDFQLRKARKSKTNEDWSVYRSLRNHVTKLIQGAKQNYNRRPT